MVVVVELELVEVVMAEDVFLQLTKREKKWRRVKAWNGGAKEERKRVEEKDCEEEKLEG